MSGNTRALPFVNIQCEASILEIQMAELHDNRRKVLFGNSQLMVSKEEYSAWEAEVINTFYEEGPRVTDLVPTLGNPAVLKKQKLILYAVEGDGATLELVAQSKTSELPGKDKLLMFHAGSQSLKKVSRGVEEDMFFHPAFDAGGLTNYRQKMGEPVEHVGDAMSINQNCNLEESAVALHQQWSRLAKKAMPKSLISDLKSWLVSALFAFQKDVQVHFLALPEEHRVLIMAEDVRKKTGKYFTRCFGGSVYAEEASTSELFCAVTQKYITPNINMRNIILEYHTYADEAAKA